MPNHVHSIIVINRQEGSVETPNLGVSNASPSPNNTVSVGDISISDANTLRLGALNEMSNLNIVRCNADAFRFDSETPRLGVSTRNGYVDNGTGSPHSADGKNDKWESGTLGVIINQYKLACTINARNLHADFAWQVRFHHHIICNEKAFQQIRSYIAGNSASWEEDTL